MVPTLIHTSLISLTLSQLHSCVLNFFKLVLEVVLEDSFEEYIFDMQSGQLEQIENRAINSILLHEPLNFENRWSGYSYLRPQVLVKERSSGEHIKANNYLLWDPD